MRIRMGWVFEWFDFWVGFYLNTQKRRLYIMIPMVGFWIEMHRTYGSRGDE